MPRVEDVEGVEVVEGVTSGSPEVPQPLVEV